MKNPPPPTPPSFQSISYAAALAFHRDEEWHASGDDREAGSCLADKEGPCHADSEETTVPPRLLRGILRAPGPREADDDESTATASSSGDDSSGSQRLVTFAPGPLLIQAVHRRPRTLLPDVPALYYSAGEIRGFKRDIRRVRWRADDGSDGVVDAGGDDRPADVEGRRRPPSPPACVDATGDGASDPPSETPGRCGVEWADVSWAESSTTHMVDTLYLF